MLDNTCTLVTGSQIFRAEAMVLPEKATVETHFVCNQNGSESAWLYVTCCDLLWPVDMSWYVLICLICLDQCVEHVWGWRRCLQPWRIFALQRGPQWIAAETVTSTVTNILNIMTCQDSVLAFCGTWVCNLGGHGHIGADVSHHVWGNTEKHRTFQHFST